MSKKNRKKKKIDPSADANSFGHNPFADLFGTGQPPEPSSEGDAGPEAGEPEAAGADLTSLPRVVLRRERKGRGGKTVTLVEGLDALTEAALDTLAKDMRKALGTGAGVEEGRIVLQGDIGDRAEAWLLDHGARRVVRSG